MPIAANRFTIAGPTPGKIPTGSGARTPGASAPKTKNPRGLPRSAASFASSRLPASPIEIVTPTSASTRRDNRFNIIAGGAPCSAAVPDISSTASSIDNGRTSGVSASISRLISRETATYFAIFGRITTACGHNFSALNIGMALRTPYSRAT